MISIIGTFSEHYPLDPTRYLTSLHQISRQSGSTDAISPDYSLDPTRDEDICMNTKSMNTSPQRTKQFFPQIEYKLDTYSKNEQKNNSLV